MSSNTDVLEVGSLPKCTISMEKVPSFDPTKDLQKAARSCRQPRMSLTLPKSRPRREGWFHQIRMPSSNLIISGLAFRKQFNLNDSLSSNDIAQAEFYLKHMSDSQGHSSGIIRKLSIYPRIRGHDS